MDNNSYTRTESVGEEAPSDLNHSQYHAGNKDIINIH